MKEYKAEKGWQAVQEISQEAKKNGTSEMTLEEISTEIAYARAECGTLYVNEEVV